MNDVYKLEVENVTNIKDEWLELQNESALTVGDRVILVDRSTGIIKGAEITKRIKNKIKIQIVFCID